jgi:carboxypeptidase-like protein
MSESDNIKFYSASDIQKYLKGELSSADMHAMEKAALDDPFLADAIEGMEMTMNNYGEETINTDLGELNTAINQKADTGRVVAMRPSRWWVAAAAIAIIFGGVFVYKNFTENNIHQQPAIAKGEQAKPPAQPTIGPADESAAGLKEESKKDSTEVIAFGNGLISKSQNKPADKSYKLIDQKSLATRQYYNRDTLSSLSFSTSQASPSSLPPVQLNFDTVKGTLEGKAAGVQVVAKEDADKLRAKKDEVSDKYADRVANAKPEARNKQEELKNQNTQYLNNLNYRGRVLDNNNQPIANAVVNIEKEKNAVVTDQNGFFNINSRDSQPNATISGVGFDSRKVNLDNTIASNDIKLEPNKNALNEVVVVGYGTQKKSKTASREKPNNGLVGLSTKVQSAVPTIGWVDYQKYLENGKKLDPDIKLNSGEVVVSFIVDKKGQLSSFKIEQSLGKVEDAEAIRLIKEGPAWKLIEGKKSRTTVIIQF